jgi:arylsulfatase A-like enzyme
MEKGRDRGDSNGFRHVLLAAVCAALVTGIGEAAADGVQILVLRRLIFVSYDVAWMSPLAYVVIFVPIALLLYAATRLIRRPLSFTAAVGIFAALGVFCWLITFTQISRWASLVLSAGVGVQLARVAGRAPARWARGVRIVAATGAIISVVTGVTVRLVRVVAERRALAALPAAQPGRPNILLFVLDTVRRANMGLYGYRHANTPVLRQLAARGVVFDRAIATAPWTLTSHASMFSGLGANATGGDWRIPVSREPRVLAEALRDQGYVSGGFVANLLYTTYESGLTRGFAHYDDFHVTPHLVMQHSSPSRTRLGTRIHEATTLREVARAFLWNPSLEPSRTPGDQFRPAAAIADEFLDWQRTADDRPFFAFINFFDAHGPYRAPDEYLRRFTGGPSAEIDRYDAAIAYMDHEIGRVLDSLERRGALANTVIIVTSDHGEEFGEHGLRGHANSLYLPLLEVPLVLAGPGVAASGVRVDALTTMRDLPSTVLDVAGIADRGIPGTSLSRYWRGGSPAPSDVVAEVSRAINSRGKPNSDGPMVSRMDERLHYIRDGHGKEELYAWRTDSLETENLAGRPDMQADLARLRAGFGPPPGGTTRVAAAGTP